MRALPLAALMLLLLPAVAPADIWQWTDEQGAVRYTPDPGRVPSGARGTLVKVEPGMPPTRTAAQPKAAPAIAEPVPALAPGEDLSADPFNAPQAARSVEVSEVPEPAWAVPSEAAAASPGAGSDAWSTPAEAAAATPAAAGATASATASAEAPPPGATAAAEAPPPGAPAAVSAPPPPSPEQDAWAAAATAATAAPTGAAPEREAGSPAPIQTADARAAVGAVGAAAAPAVDPWVAVAAGSAGTATLASAGPPPPLPPEPVELTPEQRSRRDELETLIADDEETLKRLLSDPALDAPGFEQSEELQTIARRLPVLQAELRALEEGRLPPETDPEQP